MLLLDVITNLEPIALDFEPVLGTYKAIAPVALAAIIQAIPALVKAGYGVGQMIQSKKLGTEKRPEYEIPESISKMLQNSQNLAGQRELPGATVMEERLKGTTANMSNRMMEGTAGSGAMLGGLAELAKAEQQGLQDIGIQGADYYRRNQLQLQNALNTMGKFEDQKWKYNKLDPYMEAKYAEAALKGAGAQNMFGGFKDVAGAGSQAMFWQEMMGNTTGGGNADGSTNIMSNEIDPETGELTNESFYNFDPNQLNDTMAEKERNNIWDTFSSWSDNYQERKADRELERDINRGLAEGDGDMPNFFERIGMWMKDPVDYKFNKQYWSDNWGD